MALPRHFASRRGLYYILLQYASLNVKSYYMQKNKLDSKLPPWKKPKRKGKGFKLSPEQIEEAKQRAADAGRRYPNLVDNMYVARKYKILPLEQ